MSQIVNIIISSEDFADIWSLSKSSEQGVESAVLLYRRLFLIITKIFILLQKVAEETKVLVEKEEIEATKKASATEEIAEDAKRDLGVNHIYWQKHLTK